MAHALPIEDLPGVRVSNQYMVDVLTEARDRLGLDVPLPDASFAAERVGVSERSYLDRGFETEDLAWAACEKLVPHIDRDRLKVILVSSVTYTRMVPSLASVLHERLKLGHDVVAFDSPLACHGFVGGFKVVEGLLQGHPPDSQGLLVAAELMSRRGDAFDRQTSVIFGDGAGASGVSASHSYTQPGSYSAQLRVTDNSGLSASSAVTITVDAPIVILPIRVADIALSVGVARNGQAKATAAVTVVNGNGQAVAGAVVTGDWSGLVSRKGASASTGSNGVASLVSPNTRATSGSFVFTVTGVSLAGHVYQPATNTETSDSIAR